MQGAAAHPAFFVQQVLAVGLPLHRLKLCGSFQNLLAPGGCDVVQIGVFHPLPVLFALFAAEAQAQLLSPRPGHLQAAEQIFPVGFRHGPVLQRPIRGGEIADRGGHGAARPVVCEGLDLQIAASHQGIDLAAVFIVAPVFTSCQAQRAAAIAYEALHRTKDHAADGRREGAGLLSQILQQRFPLQLQVGDHRLPQLAVLIPVLQGHDEFLTHDEGTDEDRVALLVKAVAQLQRDALARHADIQPGCQALFVILGHRRGFDRLPLALEILVCCSLRHPGDGADPRQSRAAAGQTQGQQRQGQDQGEQFDAVFHGKLPFSAGAASDFMQEQPCGSDKRL